MRRVEKERGERKRGVWYIADFVIDLKLVSADFTQSLGECGNAAQHSNSPALSISFSPFHFLAAKIIRKSRVKKKRVGERERVGGKTPRQALK